MSTPIKFTRTVDEVTIQMTAEQYERLIWALSYATGAALRLEDREQFNSLLSFVDDLKPANSASDDNVRAEFAPGSAGQ